MTKTELKTGLQVIDKELEAISKRLLEMDKEELQEALKKLEFKYRKIEEERNILKQILQDIRKATNSLGSLYRSDQQKDFLKILPEDEL